MTAPLIDPCPGCGYKAGRTACQDLFNDIALRIRALAWTGSMQTWRLLHDVYDIQHEADFCGRYRGLIMHLGGVCLALEHGGEERDYKKLQKFVELDSMKDKPYPPAPGIPASRGTITVANLEEAESPERLIAGVDRWARSAWEAYRPLQAIAREWVREALKIK
jgi:hypothetical protein